MKGYTLCVALLIIILLLAQYSNEKKRKKDKHRYGRWKGSKGSGGRSREHWNGGGKGSYSGKSGSKQHSREQSREYWIARTGEYSREYGSRRSTEGSRRYSKESSKSSQSSQSSKSSREYSGISGSREHGYLPPDSGHAYPEIKYYCEPKKRVWLFGVTGLVSPVVLVDSSGRLVGFGLDLVTAVCGVAGETCRVIKVPPDYCSQFINGYFFAGDPLLYGVIDGCLHQQVIVNRFDVVDYTLPYQDPTTAMFHVRLNDARHFHVTRLDGKVIAYLKVSSADEDCILRNGIKGALIVGYSSYQDAVRDVLTKKVFAFFSYRTTYAGLSSVSRHNIQCNRGWAMMTRPGSDLTTWWNGAYSKLKTTPKYRAICIASRTKYGASMQCSKSTPWRNSTVPRK